jgi:hypothetical protein
MITGDGGPYLIFSAATPGHKATDDILDTAASQDKRLASGWPASNASRTCLLHFMMHDVLDNL